MRFICLGDLPGWLPFGDQTFERTRSSGFPTVAGNHDLLIAGAITDHPDQLDRMQATAYNAGLIFPIPGAVDYILGLPLSIEKDDFTVVHHSPFTLPSGGTRSRRSELSIIWMKQPAGKPFPRGSNYPKRLIFSGHDHIPAIFELAERGEVKIHRPELEKSLR